MKNILYEFAIRINSHYVSDDCVQLMLPYKKAVTLLNEDKILFHKLKDSAFVINDYLDDDRKNNFPYSNIPQHKTLFPKGIINYTNYLMEFDKPYIIFKNGIFENYAVKDGNEAIVVTKVLIPDEEKKIFTFDQYRKSFFEDNLFDHRFLMEGSIYLNSTSFKDDTEEELINRIRKYYFGYNEVGKRIINGDVVHDNKHRQELTDYLVYTYPIEKILSDEDIHVADNGLKVIKNEKGGLTVVGMDAKMLDLNKYEATIYKFNTCEYSLNKAKAILQATGNITAKEPVISRCFNKGIERSLIKEEKRKVKELVRK